MVLPMSRMQNYFFFNLIKKFSPNVIERVQITPTIQLVIWLSSHFLLSKHPAGLHSSNKFRTWLKKEVIWTPNCAQTHMLPKFISMTNNF